MIILELAKGWHQWCRKQTERWRARLIRNLDPHLPGSDAVGNDPRKEPMIERVGRYGSLSVILTIYFSPPEDGIIREDELADFYTKFVKLESQEAKVVAKTAHDTMTDVRITI